MHAATAPATSAFWVSSPESSSLRRRNRSLPMSLSVRIAVVGDVHDDWDLQHDAKALQFLKTDLVLFTGDFGNENVELVRSVSELKMPKAIILGNHDCWHTPQFMEKRKDRVQLQLDCLGVEHVGYCRLDFPMSKLSIVGARPFSCGGDKIFQVKLLSARYGVDDMEGSAEKIYEAALGAPVGYSVIFLAHNGPAGLGSKVNDICGRDWVVGGGDHGDPDLTQSILNFKRSTKREVSLVVFGHMHKELAYRKGLRRMVVSGADSTVYVNGAIVPRVKRTAREQGSSSGGIMRKVDLHVDDCGSSLRAFTMICMIDGRVEKITENWVLVSGEETSLQEENLLFERGNSKEI